MDFAVGSFVQPTSVGPQSVVDVGFKPKALMLHMTHLTSDGTASGMELADGIIISATERWTIARSAVDGSNSAGKRIDELAILIITGGTAYTVAASADFTSFDLVGFTLNWGVVDATPRIINYVAFGGNDLSVDANVIESPASTGLQAETTAFEPDGTLFVGSHFGTTFPLNDSWAEASYGGAVDASNEVFSGHSNQNGASSKKGQLSTKAVGTVNGVAFTYWEQAQFDSKSATDFTLDWTSVQSFVLRHLWLALKGINFSVGTFDLSTSLGNQSVVDVGFKPDGVVLFSICAAATPSVLDEAALSYGVAKSSTERFVVAAESDSGNNPQRDTSLKRTQIFQSIESGTPTIEAEADFVSFDADGFTIDNETVDATSREVIYVAFGSIGGAVPVIMDSYQRRRRT